MIVGHGGLAGLRFRYRKAAPGAEIEEIPLGLRIEHAAAANDERTLGRGEQRRGFLHLARIGRGAADAVDAGGEEALGIIVGLRLHVLAEGERDGAAFGGIGQNGDCAVERGHDLLGPRNAVEIARNRAETIVGADRAVAEILDLLQHRVGLAGGEHVAGNEQHGQAVDMRDRGGRHHVGGAGADRGRAGHHAPASRGLGEGDGRVRHRLLVMGAIGRQLLSRAVERLAQARHVAVAENREHALEQPLLAPVHDDALPAQEANHRLRGGQTHHGLISCRVSPWRKTLAFPSGTAIDPFQRVRK